MNTQKFSPGSLKQSLLAITLFKWSSRREKQSMKTESTVLAGQRETTYHEEKESRYRSRIFFLVFCCSSDVFAGFFSTVAYLV